MVFPLQHGWCGQVADILCDAHIRFVFNENQENVPLYKEDDGEAEIKSCADDTQGYFGEDAYP